MSLSITADADLTLNQVDFWIKNLGKNISLNGNLFLISAIDCKRIELWSHYDGKGKLLNVEYSDIYYTNLTVTDEPWSLNEIPIQGLNDNNNLVDALRGTMLGYNYPNLPLMPPQTAHISKRK